MSLKTRPIESFTNTVYSIPRTVLLQIFQSLDRAGCLTARRVCKLWEAVAMGSTTILGIDRQEKSQIKTLATVDPVYCSEWEQVPSHWKIPSSGVRLKFSSVHQDIISFSSRLVGQSSKFYSFTKTLPFSGHNIVLAQYKNTYFLTPQETQTENKPLKRPKSLRPTLVVKNLDDPQQDRTASPLESLSQPEENFISHQIRYCFPMPEGKVAIVTSDGTISLWDLEPLRPVCYKKLQLEFTSPHLSVYKVGNYLLIENKVISLNDLSMRRHAFHVDQFSLVKKFGSFVCASKKEGGEFEFFILTKTGLLEKKWSYKIPRTNGLDECGGLVSVDIENMSKDFIVLHSRHENGFKLFILNMNGELVDSARWTYLNIGENPAFAQTSGNILIFKHPKESTFHFSHLFMNVYETRFADTLEPYFGKGEIQDMRLIDGKLTVLLAKSFVERSNLPAQFRLIQFNSLESPSALSNIVTQVIDTFKNLFKPTGL